MDASLVTAIISTAGLIIVAIITGVISYKTAKLSKKFDQDKEEEDRRAKQRKEEALLSLKMMKANSQLTIGIAMALKHGKANGEVEEGLEAVDKANKEYEEFLNKIAMDDLH